MSNARFEKTCNLIPWGTQTNGKRPESQQGGATPFFAERAEGCRFLASNGRWYIDYRSALGPIILGYNHPSVQEAVRKQLEKGVIFSLASPLEYDLAERLADLIPGLEQVRYLKSGNEANLAAIRLARAYTGRDLIVTCGYHGHGDWFSAGTGMPFAANWPREGNGVPGHLDTSVVRIAYGDHAGLNRVFTERGADVAGLIMVPYDWGPRVDPAFVSLAREVTRRYGAALVFDQILTGFRLDLRGAQGYFGVIPDLTTYGKAIANGYPLAVFGGRRDLMQMLDQVMITTTHAGETLSIAAAIATLDILQTEPILETIWANGERLQRGFGRIARKASKPAIAPGLAPAPFFQFDEDPETDRAKRQRFNAFLLEQGIFPNRHYLINFAHDAAVIDETLAAMEGAMACI